MVLKGACSYTIKLGPDASGNIARMDNALEKIPTWLKDEKRDLQKVQQQLEATRAELETPFARAEELEQKSKRLNELNILLNLDKKDKTLIDDGPDEDAPVVVSRSRDYER